MTQAVTTSPEANDPGSNNIHCVYFHSTEDACFVVFQKSLNFLTPTLIEKTFRRQRQLAFHRTLWPNTVIQEHEPSPPPPLFPEKWKVESVKENVIMHAVVASEANSPLKVPEIIFQWGPDATSSFAAMQAI
ncbi:hypothetical protein Bpfe_023644 [Biomphalaria pfeifferi]|uniref:Uncharacterized protein n=1 Tax=Biomphalaria pfeifferi TaxID=112525 RepID=A0AAD8B2S2_BIOPF|nr:hypothetical protein Bpfe_023644 [Biomphalaria pfeifferi]